MKTKLPSQIEVFKSIRKEMPPPRRIMPAKKGKGTYDRGRAKRDWQKEE